MRKENSIKNIIVSVLMNIINIVIGFIAQKKFLVALGEVYLGINGLFLNIISILSIAELGIGTVIIYNLYKPIAEDNRNKIKSLMNYYKKSYRIIAVVVLFLGSILIPFLNVIIGNNNIELNSDVNIYIIFFLFLIDAVASYLLTYKRTILYADQKNYLINIVHIAYIIVMNILQIVFLLNTHNYYIYLIIKIICRVAENIIINLIVNRLYPYINEKCNDKLDSKTEEEIKKRVKGSFFHNIGTFLVLGTDNIIISRVLGVVIVGLYSNYNLIINAVNALLVQIFTAITASVGNLLVENNKKKSYNIEKKVYFANFWLYAIATIFIYEIMEPFIVVWIGQKYVLSNLVLLVLVINFYIQGMRRTMQVFGDAAGICYENRYVPIAEALVDIIASIILAKWLGLAGVFLGTIMSSLVLHIYSFPKYIYSPVLGRNKKEYIIEIVKKFFVMLFVLIITTIIVKIAKVNNVIAQIIINITICSIIPNIILFIIYRKTEEFKYYTYMFLEFKNKIIIKLLNK